ncbi:transcription intermediary factor 1-beta-like [Ruditapes philippinarum]|uniref:transcription intermediary factor 1-beta-like n=1 Tax=Ruditapes philippinarum TaxID=129788 RepID=UPI00295A9C93|nr:transcription intermediary factor 1-beta-like [Ruditapes philippinarum]
MANSRIDFSASFTQDSDEVQEMFCEVCDKHDKQYVPAEGFCEECFEYLCETCLKYHRVYKKSHTIKDKDNMPQDFCLEKCSVHQDELVKFYCQACKKFACTECKTRDHGNCGMVGHLPALVPGIENSQEVKELNENLDELMKDLGNTEKHVNINMKYVTSQETKILDTVMKKKKEILSVFEKHHKDIIQNFEKKKEETFQKLEEEKKEKIEKLQDNQRKLEKLLNDEENEIKKKIEIIKRDDMKIVQAITEETSKMKIKLKAISTELVHHQNTDQRCQLYVAMKKGQEIIEQLKPDIDKQCKDNSIHYYKVKCKAFEQNATNLQDFHKFFTYKEIHESEVPRTASYYTDIKFTCHSFSSLCLLTKDCLLITEFDSCKLIIFKDLSVSNSSYDTIH